MRTKFIIFKKTRMYLGGSGYAGPTCIKANIPLGKIYSNLNEAEKDAKILSELNSVGFEVLPYKRIKLCK